MGTPYYAEGHSTSHILRDDGPQNFTFLHVATVLKMDISIRQVSGYQVLLAMACLSSGMSPTW